MESFITIGTSKLWVSMTGTGLPCILCNGGPGCDDYLAPIAEMLDDMCQTVRFEPRGCGRSDWDGKYDIDTTVDDIDAIRAHFGFSHIIIGGHSAGPDVALAYTIKYPQHVIALFGIAGGRIVNDRDWSATYRQNLQATGEDLGGNVFTADPQVNEIGNRSWREYIKRAHLLADIAAIRCPAIFIGAEKDIRPNWPTQQIANALAHGTYVEIKGAAHLIWLTHYNQLRTVLRQFVLSLTAPTHSPSV